MAFDPLNKVGHQQLNPNLNNELDNMSSAMDLLVHRNNNVAHITGEERRKWNETLSLANDYTDYQLESIIGQFDFENNKKTLIENIRILETQINNVIATNDAIYSNRFSNAENRILKLEQRADGHDTDIANIRSDISTKYTQVQKQITDTNDKLYLEQMARQSADTKERTTTINQINQLTATMNTKISDEATARSNQDTWLKNYIDQKIKDLDAKFTTNLNNEITARKDADTAEQQARIKAVAQEAEDRTKAVTNEANARASADATEADLRYKGDQNTLNAAKSYASGSSSSSTASANAYTDQRINSLYKITNSNLTVSNGVLYYDYGSGNWARVRDTYE